MKKVLYIDTSNSQKTLVRLSRGEKVTEQEESSGKKRKQTVLPLVDKLLKSEGISLKDIDEIQVNEGPGSFTGLRIGVAIANTLAHVLGIPINGKKNQLVEPIYA